MAQCAELTRLDLLPPEVVEHIAQFLPTIDICALERTSHRLSISLRRSPQLRLHFLRRQELLSRVASDTVVRSLVNGNCFLRERVNLHFSYTRFFCDTWADQLDREAASSQLLFYCWPGHHSGTEKVNQLLAIAKGLPTQRPYSGFLSSCTTQMVLVIAEGVAEAEAFHQALVQERLESNLVSGQFSEAEVVNSSIRRPWWNWWKKHFVCIPELPPDFKIFELAAVISFRKLRSADDFLAVEAQRPGEAFHLMPAEPHFLAVAEKFVSSLEDLDLQVDP